MALATDEGSDAAPPGGIVEMKVTPAERRIPLPHPLQRPRRRSLNRVYIVNTRTYIISEWSAIIYRFFSILYSTSYFFLILPTFTTLEHNTYRRGTRIRERSIINFTRRIFEDKIYTRTAKLIHLHNLHGDGV